ncbi:MAG TPA: dihydropteroate synthase [Bacteroidales bacterium]|nr:MAG: dihydropteroate synthase [Bacteroidetes bacterium GWF2_33_38]OFY88908.1 MAG: dihydropteroate synthase [Bacteroidetes bacterium RIFOXYA2_FULL_33_7]HBF87630.1 dihydropteroate synthase [Bacteroidales bacterium]
MNPKKLTFNTKTTINCSGKLLDLSSPRIMGILNLTPDSFFDGGKYKNEKQIANRIENIISEGADIIDLGAVSTRPGANLLNYDEELHRLDFALNFIQKYFKQIIVSVDTFRADVAQKVVADFEVDIINDISGGTMDKNMYETVAKLNVPYIMMHIQGTPAIMQVAPNYQDVVKEIITFFVEKVEKLKKLGVNDIIIDPGFGFGKTLEHNYIILKNLTLFKMLELPILVGLSRKSMIYKLLSLSPEDVLPESLALNSLALNNGANILRVHDVKETQRMLKIFEKYSNS